MQRIAKSGTPFFLTQKPFHFLQPLMCDVRHQLVKYLLVILLLPCMIYNDTVLSDEQECLKLYRIVDSLKNDLSTRSCTSTSECGSISICPFGCSSPYRKDAIVKMVDLKTELTRVCGSTCSYNCDSQAILDHRLSMKVEISKNKAKLFRRSPPQPA